MKATSGEADPSCDDPEVLRRARIALAAVCEPGEPELVRAIKQHGTSATIAGLLSGTRSLRGVPRAESLGRRLAELDLETLLARGEDLGIRVIVPGDAHWPVRLNDLGDRSPLALWCWGDANPRLQTVRSVAFVGARACSRYGEFVARDWSAQLASEGIAVVSGGAYGIDAAAHRGALAVDGVTICVLAGGVDIAYPRGHEGLFAEIIERGLVVSEAPLGDNVRRRRFLTRNRVIAALASATCVVEAAERSGSARTAGYASAMHRPVLAVPGPVTSEVSRGTHRLINDGLASLAADIDDVRSAIDPITIDPRSSDRVDAIGRRMREVLDVLPTAPRGASRAGHVGADESEISLRSGQSHDQVKAHLRDARALGVVSQTPDGRWHYLPEAEPQRRSR